jgi:hypothetical protein
MTLYRVAMTSYTVFTNIHQYKGVIFIRKQKVVRWLLALMFAFVLIFTVVGSVGLPKAYAQANLTDISTHWARVQIEKAIEKGYVSGYPDATFQPDKVVTRAEFIRLLVDALKLPHSLYGEPWYMPYVAAALDVGVHKQTDFYLVVDEQGIDDEQQRSSIVVYEQKLARLELVRLAVRSADLSFQSADAAGSDDELVRLAVDKGLIHGVGDGELHLSETVTRAQAAVVIERVLAIIRGEKLAVDVQALTKFGEE